MILLVGTRRDAPLASVERELRSLRASFAVADTESSALSLTRPWTPAAEAVVSVDGGEIDLSDVAAAYLRPFPVPARGTPAHDALSVVLAWADTTSLAAVVNRPVASTLNASKPLQLETITKHGLRTPRTLITTSPADVHDFQREVGEVVYKSVSHIRSIVRRLSPDQIDDLSRVEVCPTQFQQYIPGKDVRVHVIDGAVHPILIHSDADDYRYAIRSNPPSAEPVTLPRKLEEELVTMVRAMGLVFAGVDLRWNTRDEWYCLEVNPSPGFTFYERLSGTRLSTFLAEYLVSVDLP